MSPSHSFVRLACANAGDAKRTRNTNSTAKALSRPTAAVGDDGSERGRPIKNCRFCVALHLCTPTVRTTHAPAPSNFGTSPPTAWQHRPLPSHCPVTQSPMRAPMQQPLSIHTVRECRSGAPTATRRSQKGGGCTISSLAFQLPSSTKNTTRPPQILHTPRTPHGPTQTPTPRPCRPSLPCQRPSYSRSSLSNTFVFQKPHSNFSM